MSRIIKTKYYCKGTSQVGGGRGAKLGSITWVDRFVEGKWYDGTYELWSDDETRNNTMYRLNNKWKKYKVINESGVEEEISISHMNCIFEMDKEENRNIKIEQILKK